MCIRDRLYDNTTKLLVDEEKDAIQPKPLFKPLVVFHKIEIYNTIHFDRTIKLEIKVKEGSNANFYVPQSKLKTMLSRYETQIYHIQKDNPELDFGEYTLDLQLARQKQPSSIHSNDFLAAQSSSVPPATNVHLGTSGNLTSKN
eukprot:TRINITY_DN9676_c0_g1_i1.p1 TRINITY_DN9676_c0_g1~~TRINITY_DN9676_c0_g1_i1.p1  ORF type:complete len:144 (+),score=13.54 TRINITY_DN9676_c0_g1_i1:114-545(+)